MELIATDAIHIPPARTGGPHTHRQLVAEMATFATIDSRKGTLLFVAEFALFWTALAAVLFAPGWWLKVLASVIVGIKMANLITLAHDAAHNTLTRSRRLNWIIGTLSFATGLFNYRLWVYDHHALHHPHTNGEHVDSYQPLTKDAYDTLPAAAQWRYRFFRSGNPLAYGIYYITQRWWCVKLMPRAFLPAAHRKSAWQHFAFVAAYFTLLMTALILAPLYAPIDSLSAILLGFVLPFFIFQTLMGMSLYVNHTHPSIPWFATEAERRAIAQPEYMTLHLRFPKWFAALLHNFFEHPAHHVYPAIPCYRLWDAQVRLNEMLGERAIVEDFSPRTLAGIARTCRLYDFEHHRWLDYDGTPTSPVCPLVLAHPKPVTSLQG